MFLGIDMCGFYEESKSFSNDDNYVSVGKCIVDELFLSSDWTNSDYKEWDFDTILHAKFEDNLCAGNVDFAASQVDCIRIKMKPSNEYRWRTIFEKKIDSNEDFVFKYLYPYGRNNTDYDFSLTPVFSGGIEGNINKSTITSQFEGLYMMEADRGYQAYLNLEISHKNNKNISTQSTLGRKYPFIICNGESNYVTGDINATFIQRIGYQYDVENGWKYRENVNDFLLDGLPKLIKNDNGSMWLASITDVDEDYSQHKQMPIHKIQFTEIGNCDNTVDLYNAGLINCNVEWI